MIKSKHSKLNVLLISIFLISIAVLLLYPQLSTKTFAEDNNWHVGECVTKYTYVKYRMSHFDTNNGRELTMMIYFKEQDDKGNWIAPVYVQDQGKVLNGTFVLSPLDLTALGTSEIPPEMGKIECLLPNHCNG